MGTEGQESTQMTSQLNRPGPVLFTVESENSASSQSAVCEVLLLSEEGGSSEAKRKCVLLYFYCDSIHCPPHPAPGKGEGAIKGKIRIL